MSKVFIFTFSKKQIKKFSWFFWANLRDLSAMAEIGLEVDPF